MSFCYINGQMSRYEECRLHISDLQFQRGYGVFDFFRIREGRIPWLEDYTDRLYRSVEYAGIRWDLSRPDFHAILEDLQQKNGTGPSAFKVMVTGGYSETLDRVSNHANVIILQIPWNNPDPAILEQGVNLITAEYLRPNPEIKTLFYFNTLRLREKMKTFGAVDLLFHTDLVSECSRASVFYVKEGKLCTTSARVLEGITRKQVLSLDREILHRDLPYLELYELEELFITSTSMDVCPVVAVDGRPIGRGKPGPVTREIQEAYGDLLL
jgi:D-alanine transaminase/branched-chain amino acid aminotransferase